MIRPTGFEFHNARTARTAADLLQILEEGPTDLYTDHVVIGDNSRNDFAAWAETALGETVLATKLREVQSRDETLTVLKTWLAPHTTKLDMSKHHRTDFLLGLAVGLIVGILLMAVVAMLN